MLYLSLLNKFLDRITGTAPQVRVGLGDGDIPLATRMAHTLRGMAANLGAERCRELGAGLEQALKRGADLPELDSLLLALDGYLADLARHLRHALPQPAQGAKPTTASANANPLPDLCSALVILLTSHDVSAKKFIQNNADVLGQGLGNGFILMQREVKNFECERALDALNMAVAAAKPLHL